MDTSELLRRAWEAVQESGIPEPFQQAALQAAVEDLRAQESGNASGGTRDRSTRSRGGGKSKSKSGGGNAGTDETTAVDEGAFYATLADESGVPEKDLRDVLSYANGTVHVQQPTRELGDSEAEQARTVIALVAGARSFGMNERPVSADAVRAELERKRCYQSNNFAAKHLGPLRGFNAGGNRTEIVTTSKWVDEFSAAVDQALGRNNES